MTVTIDSQAPTFPDDDMQDAGSRRLSAHLCALDMAIKQANRERDEARRGERDMLAANLLLQGQLDAVFMVNRKQIDEIRDLHAVIERLQVENERLRGVATAELPIYRETRRGRWRR